MLLILLGMAVLTACGGGGGDSASIAGGGRGGDSIGFLTLSITDAPIDNAAEVWIQFSSVTLKHEAMANTIVIPFNPPMDIDLLALQGQNSFELFADQILPAGNYDWIRFDVIATLDGVLDSYIKLKNDSTHELDIPSGSESGLKINNQPRIVANVPTDMTVDFDLRKSINLTGVGEFKLAPSLKLVQDDLTGTFRGTVELSTITNPKNNCDADDPDLNEGNAVYLYSGFNVMPDDVGSAGEPEQSAFALFNNSTGKYEYEFGFVPFGKYTVAFTCQAKNDTGADEDIEFIKKTKNVQIANTDPKTIPGNTFR